MMRHQPICHSFCWLLVLMAVFPGCFSRNDTPNQLPTLNSKNLGTRDAPKFRSVGAEIGFGFTYQNGEESGHCAILESLGGGVGLLDFDRDDRLDLFLPSGGKFGSGPSIEGIGSRLFQQSPDLRFDDRSQFAGVSIAMQYSHGVATSDYNNDGFPDVLVTGYGGVTLWHNQGDGTFGDATMTSGLRDPLWSSSVGWGDFNGDGSLDVYIVHYANWSFANHPVCGSEAQPDVCPPRRFEGLDDSLFLSDGAGSFANATATAQLKPHGKGLGVVLVDVDGDLDIDAYVANDTDDNFLYINDGTGRFEETGILSGTAVDDKAQPNGSMGVAVLDYNSDGLADLWVANYEDETFCLYQNEGRGFFSMVSSKTGIEAVGRLQVGFGTVSGDFDGDGDEDLVVANGHVIHHPKNAPLKQEPLFLLNQEGRRFERVLPPPGDYLSTPHLGRGLAQGDLDDDGDLDLVFVNSNEPAEILLNQSGDHGRWLLVELVGTLSPRDGTGARVVMFTTQGERIRHLFGGGSYLSASARPAHFGYGPEMSPQKVTVEWPSGRVSNVALTTADIQRKRVLVVE